MELGKNPSPLLYVIGDRGAFKHDDDWLKTLVKVADALLAYEHVALQVRVKGSSAETRYIRMQKAREKLEPAIDSGLRVFLNGDILQARRLGYKGVHFKEDLLHQNFENPNQIEIATSTHSIESIQQSLSIGASFCVFGPVYKPGCKDVAPVGLQTLKSMTSQSKLDILALGGITTERVQPCIEAGAKGVACISSVMRSTNPRQSIQNLIKAAQSV